MINEQLHHDIHRILRQLAFASETETEQGSTAAAGADAAHVNEQAASPQPPPPIIVYLVDNPLPEVYDDYDQDDYPDTSADTVESLPETEEHDPPTTAAADDNRIDGSPPAAAGTIPLSSTPTRPRQKSKQGILVGVLCLLLAGSAITAYLLSPLTISATVTIIPQSREITTTVTLTVVTERPANPLQHEVPGRVLSSLTLSQARTVPTTGTGHEDAQAAHGLMTFYNASLLGQTVTAGTVLTGMDGVQVVTDQDAVIPAGSLSVNGQVTVPAHAVPAGPAGNIAAHDIYGSCCRLNVFAQNSTAFQGGQDARAFPMVTQADMNGAVTSLKTSVMQSVQAALAVQVHTDESLLPPLCTLTVTSTHAVGEEATSLSVTLDERCSGVAFNRQAVHHLITQIVTEQARKQWGTGYALTGNVETDVGEKSLTTQKQASITLQVKGTSVWTSQFTDAQLHHLATLIAGKSIKEARTIVLGGPGVQSVSIQLSGGMGNSTTLPDNPAQITMGQLLGFGG